MYYKKLTQRLIQYIVSKEGQEDLKKAHERAEHDIKHLRKAAEVDPRSLTQPMMLS